ncbi:hypothetical protein BU15DRAFT_40045 [Melanogaster broomeanus]|nr:hypothetical protein BU15DRAFT_40045 [Melanogaster broomeanus]
MAFRVSDNLRCYLHEARLPAMAHRSALSEPGQLRTSLNVRPERYRKLKLVHTIDATLFSSLISDWMEEFVPCESLGVNDEDESTAERFTVPCEPYFSVSPLPLARAEDIERVFLWVDMLPMESIRRVLHLLYPESNSWKFIPCEEEPWLKTLAWSQSTTDCGKTDFVQHLMGLFLIPPWMLSSKDLEDFARGQSVCVTNTQVSGLDPDMNVFRGQEWLWSKVWDSCVSRNCPWFIVSTYTNWVFGVFSAGWTASFVSPVYASDCHVPTILELLLFWLISAMGYPGGWVVPESRVESVLRRQLLMATVRDVSPEVPAEALAVSAF